MSERFHRPTRVPSDRFDVYSGGEDPAALMRAARDSAHALVSRARASDDPELLERIASYADDHGIDSVAELWANSSARSLAGTLWRVYLLRALIASDPSQVSLHFQRGTEILATIDSLVAGASIPTGPREIGELADRILHGLFRGDFAVALERAAAFCRLTASGALSIADDSDALAPDRATELTNQASRLGAIADDLTASARLWRAGSLD